MNSIFDSDESPEKEAKPTRVGSPISLVPPPDENLSEPRSDTEKPTTQTPGSSAETFRQSGLAYAAGIAFFASVVFMLVIGWGADLLFGTSPWGIVIGIVLGSVIGFVQFFRINSQIFGHEKGNNSGRMLMTDDDDDK